MVIITQDLLIKDIYNSNISGIVPSSQFSDYIYHFTREPNLLHDALRRSAFTLNYVVEHFDYLGTSNIHNIAFPMLCFCDIYPEPERLCCHAETYGYYGIGLTKEWGIRNGVQPVHYLIEGSPFSRDLAEAIDAAFDANSDEESEPLETLSNFLITVLAYSKPTYGFFNGKRHNFEDECEWRFVPADLPTFLLQFLAEPTDDLLGNYCGMIHKPESYLLRFEYTDVNAIYVPDNAAADEMRRRVIDNLNADQETRKKLCEYVEVLSC